MVIPRPVACRGSDRLTRFASDLRYDNGGNIFPMAVGAILVMAALVGGGLDASRSYRVKNRLQNACDSAVLAGRRAVTTNGYDATAQAQATTFFNTNYDQTQQGTTGTTFVTSSADNGITVNGTAATTLKALVMQLFGTSTMTFSVTCSATMEMGNADVTFVLDTTGSMADQPSGFTTSKIVALQAAVKNFYTTIANSVTGTNARIRYAFVPYSSSVNVGKLLYNLNPAYLSDDYGVQSRVPRFEVTNYVTFSGSSTLYKTDQTAFSSSASSINSSVSQYSTTLYGSWAACHTAKPKDLDDGSSYDNLTVTSTSSNTSTTQTVGSTKNVTVNAKTQAAYRTYYMCSRNGNGYSIYYYKSNFTYYPYTYTDKSGAVLTPNGSSSSSSFDHFDYRPTFYDVSKYKAFTAISIPTGSSGAATSATWAGCIEERFTVPSSTVAYSTGSSAITPSTALDLDIDTAPTTDPATQWSPMMPEAGYYRASSSSLLTTITSSNTSSSTAQSGGTYCPAAAQGLQEMTSSSFNTYVNALSANGGTYHDIGMLWGARLSSPTGIFASTVNAKPTNEGKISRHIIFMTDGIPGAANQVLQAYGIENNDKRITADGSTSDDDRHEMRFRAICDAAKAKGIRVWVIGYTTALTSDLSYCASPNSSFTAMYAADLNTAFQQIARQVSQLQVTK